MKRRFLAITLCLVMILSCLSLTGCGKKDETFKIGFVGALTGSSAIAGKAVVNAVETAVKEINDAGGINGMKVEFVYRDDESDATKNLTMVEELLYKEKVDFIFGAVNSGSCAASLDIINEAKIPEIITDATSSALIDVEKYPYTFRNAMTNYTQAESLVGVVYELICQKTRYGRAVRAVSFKPDTAKLMGINSTAIIICCFAIAGGIAAYAGALIAPITFASYSMTSSIGLKGYCAALIGGLGNTKGAFVGGFLLGIIECIITLFIPAGYKDAISFVIMILVIIFMPGGFLNAKFIAHKDTAKEKI